MGVFSITHVAAVTWRSRFRYDVRRYELFFTLIVCLVIARVTQSMSRDDGDRDLLHHLVAGAVRRVAVGRAQPAGERRSRARHRSGRAALPRLVLKLVWTTPSRARSSARMMLSRVQTLGSDRTRRPRRMARGAMVVMATRAGRRHARSENAGAPIVLGYASALRRRLSRMLRATRSMRPSRKKIEQGSRTLLRKTQINCTLRSRLELSVFDRDGCGFAPACPPKTWTARLGPRRP